MQCLQFFKKIGNETEDSLISDPQSLKGRSKRNERAERKLRRTGIVVLIHLLISSLNTVRLSPFHLSLPIC